MPADNFRDLLREWVTKEIIIVNPDSLQKTGPRDTVSFETYSARVRAVESDYLRVSFQSQNRGRLETVEQFIPIARVKRASLWGEDLYLHL